MVADSHHDNILLQWMVILVWNASIMKGFKWRVLLLRTRVHKTCKNEFLLTTTTLHATTMQRHDDLQWMDNACLFHSMCLAKLKVWSQNHICNEVHVFYCIHSFLVSCYTCICNFTKDMDFGSLPSTNDYATYENAVLKSEFVTAISQHI